MQGMVLGKRYQITEQIGSGGMAVVYKGQDTLLNRPVTIKILREQYASDQAFVERFHLEAQSVARLSHPNIVSIYDVGEEGPYHYLVMEYVPGWTLKDIIRDRAPLPIAEAVNLMIQLLEGLEHAHNNGIIHRDIKPHNILVTPGGRVKIADFGLARAATEATITFPGSIIGSVHYLSPEQAKGGSAGAQSDIYALGVVFYEMLTGNLPFEGETPVAVAMQHLQGEPVPLRRHNQNVPPALESLVLKAMAKDPEERFTSAAAMHREIEKAAFSSEEPTRIMSGNTAGERTGSPPAPEQRGGKVGAVTKQTGRSRRRVRWWVALVILVAAMSGLYAGWQSFWHVADVEVPEVEGLALQQAQRILAESGLHWQIGEKRHDSLQEGYVLAQEPQAHEMVKPSRVVVLDVSLGPAMTKVPPVAGLQERAARLSLEEEGLRVSSQRQEEYNAAAAGTVLRTVPEAGTELPQGSLVQLVVSRGPEPAPVVVPNLVGLSLDSARKELDRLGLNLGEVVRAKDPSSDYFAGTVIDQEPVPGDAALAGDAVKVVISRGPGPSPKTAVIDDVRIPGDGRRHRVRILLTDARGKDQEVYNRWHDGGSIFSTSVTFYGEGSITLYVDDDAYLLDQPLED